MLTNSIGDILSSHIVITVAGGGIVFSLLHLPVEIDTVRKTERMYKDEANVSLLVTRSLIAAKS